MMQYQPSEEAYIPHSKDGILIKFLNERFKTGEFKSSYELREFGGLDIPSRMVAYGDAYDWVTRIPKIRMAILNKPKTLEPIIEQVAAAIHFKILTPP